MKPIRLLDMGRVPAVRSQTVYHAAARMMNTNSSDTIIMVTPDEPYVSVGCHQNAAVEVDLDFCRTEGLPVVRREVGGGSVYLDENQLFSQWVFQPGSLPSSLEAQFDLYARPLVGTYQALGIDAYLRPINDIHVDGRKIGGTGAAQIGDARVLVGSLMFDFDKKTMARVIKVPSEKMRDKVFESLEQYMVTMQELLDEVPDRTTVTRLYAEKVSETLDRDVELGEWTIEEEAKAEELDRWFATDEWLFRRTGRNERGIKINADVTVHEGVLKAPGGLIRAVARVNDGYLEDVSLSGDFTMLPATALSILEESLVGSPIGLESVMERLAAVYQSVDIQSPGLEPAHLAEAVHQATG